MKHIGRRLETHLWQAGRSLAALAPDRARLDDRDLIDDAAFLVDYYGTFQFDARRDWGALLIGDLVSGSPGDILFLLATIGVTDVAGEYVASRPSLSDDEATRRLIKAHLVRLDGWRRRIDLIVSALGSSDTARAYMADFDAILSGRNANAAWSLVTLVDILARDQAWTVLMADTSLAPFWRGAPSSSDEPDVRPSLVDIHSAFSGATGAIAVLSRAVLGRAATDAPTHRPHAALLLAYLHLVARVRARLNQVTDRHLDFYYKDVLGLRPRLPEADVATVFVDLPPQAKPSTLPAGTRLSAGQDADGHPIVFATTRRTPLNHAAVGALRAIRLRTNVIASTDAGDGLRSRTTEVAAINAYPVLASKDGYGRPLDAPAAGWPSFGAEFGSAPSRIGLSIRSAILRLSEGERRIVVTLRSDSPKSLGFAVDAYVARCGGSSRPVEATLDRCFLVEVSTAAGFVRAGHRTAFGRVRGTLRFTILLPADAPALSSFPAGTPGPPSLRILLDPSAPVYGYSYFKAVSLRHVAIKVAASGLVSVTTSAGREAIEATKPFAPFGSPALTGNALTVAHGDLDGKTLTSLTIRMRWTELPAGPDGFRNHYAGYGRDTTARTFRVSIAGLVGPDWIPVTDDAPLFTETDAGAAATSIWSFPARPVWPLPCPPVVRIKLTAPDYGFGQPIYPSVLAGSIMAHAVKRGAAPVEPPKAPYTPTCDRLTLDFRAMDIVAIDAGATSPLASGVFAIEPFGREVPLTDGTLLPVYPAQGYLFIGLSGMRDTRALTLHFDIAPRRATKVLVDMARRQPAVAICLACLSGDCWVPLTDEQVRWDTTQAMSRSGIVGLRLPPIEANVGHSFDPSLLWLRVQSEGNPNDYGRTLSITCNGAEVTRVLRAGSDAAPPFAPAGTIGGILPPGPNAAAVRQPLASVAGRAGEDGHAFRTRISERLRHKDRAILPRDYEAIVLDRFPTIGDAKCLGGAGGQVTIVVAPLRFDGVRNATATVPEYELRIIADHLRARCPSSVRRLIVRNPTFEPVRVVAWISFTGDDPHAGVRTLRAALDRRIAPWLACPSEPMAIGAPHVDLAGLRAVFGTVPSLTMATGISATHLSASSRPWIERRRDDDRFNSLDDSSRHGTDRVHLRPSHPHSVLVPAHHDLRLVGTLGIGRGIVEDTFVVGRGGPIGGTRPFRRAPRRAGIGNLRIEEDFLVRR